MIRKHQDKRQIQPQRMWILYPSYESWFKTGKTRKSFCSGSGGIFYLYHQHAYRNQMLASTIKNLTLEYEWNWKQEKEHNSRQLVILHTHFQFPTINDDVMISYLHQTNHFAPKARFRGIQFSRTFFPKDVISNIRQSACTIWLAMNSFPKECIGGY